MDSIAAVYAKYCRQQFPLPNEQEVDELENRLGVTFPDDYRQYLLDFNGGFFADAPVVLPEPITVEWRDGMVTHSEVALTAMNGLHATTPEDELGNPLDVHLFDDNDPLQILPIGFAAVSCLVVLDLLPGYCGNILIKFPSAAAYTVADGISEFFDLIKCDEG